MPKTAQLSLPLVMPAQAQKHVTVNQALAIIDAVAQLRVVGSTTLIPPSEVKEGASYIIPEGAVGAWNGMSGAIAVRSNGGWIFLKPRRGWRAWNDELAGWQTYDGARWTSHVLAVSPSSAQLSARILEFDHTVVAGASNLSTVSIPARTQVVGVSGRVAQAISGTSLTGWRLGVSGSDNRYGSGLGTALNSYVVGLSSAPVTYYSSTPLVLTAEGGHFASGVVRLAIHLLEIVPPLPI